LQWQHVDLPSAGRPIPLTPATIAIFAPAMVAFALVMLIACANVINVMLARGIARQREIGVRLALGAGRARLVRQLLTECAMLALPAAGLGFVISRWSLSAAVQVTFATVPSDIASMLRLVPLSPDIRVFAFLLATALLCAVLFGLVPALQATRPNIVQASRGDFDTQFRTGRARNALVVIQVAMCSLLLIVTGLLLRGAEVAHRSDPGMRTRDVVEFAIAPEERVPVLQRLAHDSIVVGIGASSQVLLDGIYPHVAVLAGDRHVITPAVSFVDSGFFGVLGIPITMGRTFTTAEARDTAAVVIVNAAAAHALWPGQDPVGQIVQLAAVAAPQSRLTRVRLARVIGVSANATNGWIGVGRDQPAIYYPSPAEGQGMWILVRTRVAGSVARDQIDRSLWLASPGSVREIFALEDYLAAQVWPFLAFSWVAMAIGAIALVLTLIGIYGVLSYLVAQRTREIGIRMAIGASVNRVVLLVTRQVATLAGIGLIIGVLLSLAASRVFATFLVIVDTFDWVGYGFGVALVIIGAAAAAWAPARRAALVNPVTALRND
jgi:predicted permease